MEQTFFPPHITVEIILLNFLTALALMLVLASGAPRAVGRGLAVAPQLRLGLLLALWYAVVYPLVATGWISLDVRLFGVIPTLVPAIALPALAGTLLLYSADFRARLDAVPMAWLAAFHGLRIAFGFVFLAIYELGAIPAAFAFRGGYGDIVAGLLGLLVAYLYASGYSRALARAAAVVWIVQGMGDFALVLYTGLTQIPPDSAFRGYYPFMLIPAFVVPMFILTHIYAIRALVTKKDWTS